MTNPNTLSEMDTSIIDAVKILTDFRLTDDPVRKIQLVRQVINDLQNFDQYWSDTFEDNINA